MTKDQLQQALDKEKQCHRDTKAYYEQQLVSLRVEISREGDALSRFRRILTIIRSLIDHELGVPMSTLAITALVGAGALAAYMMTKMA